MNPSEVDKLTFFYEKHPPTKPKGTKAIRRMVQKEPWHILCGKLKSKYGEDPEEACSGVELRRVLLLQARPFDAPDASLMRTKEIQGAASCIERWFQYDKAGINAHDAKKRFESDVAGVGQVTQPNLEPLLSPPEQVAQKKQVEARGDAATHEPEPEPEPETLSV